MKPSLSSQNVDIFMVTSSDDPNDLKRAQNFEEITGYVVKPVFEEKLAEILTEVYNKKW